MANVDVTRIASNIGALNALNSLTMINSKLAMHQTRLSTGKRINSAADDPAGLTIATKMLARSEGLKVALSNIGDANNMLAVAEAGLSKMNDILVQMRGKAEQAASDTLGTTERNAIQTQLSAYAEQIQDLVDQTKWNGVKLLDRTTGTKQFQTGVDEGEYTQWSLSTALDPNTGLMVSTNVPDNKVTADATSIGAGLAIIAAAETGTLVGALSRLTTGSYGVKVVAANASATDSSFTETGGSLAPYASITKVGTGAATLASDAYSLNITGVSGTAGAYVLTYNLVDSTGNTEAGSPFTTAALDFTAGDHFHIQGDGTNGQQVNIGAGTDISNWVSGAKLTFDVLKATEAKLQLQRGDSSVISVSKDGTDTVASSYFYKAAGGVANSGTGASVTLGTAAQLAAKAAAGGLSSFSYAAANKYSVDVSTATVAASYMTTVNGAMDKVNTTMASLGSLMARLTFKEDAVATAQVNVEGAYSRIMNANMAEEQMNASKYTILQQTAVAMLAQANQAPQSLLALFR